LGEHEAERDGGLFHEEAAELWGNYLMARMSICRLVSSSYRACHLYYPTIKRGQHRIDKSGDAKTQ
jgi:hypothetical protein